jgi:thymidine kinase
LQCPDALISLKSTAVENIEDMKSDYITILKIMAGIMELYADCGYLEIIKGPMFSGKTTRLVNLYNQYIKEQKNVCVINYSQDKRYHDTMLSTHDKVMIPCIFTNKIADIWESISKAEIILINEGQFFADLYDEVFKMIEIEGKKVHICGLDGDFLRKKFGNISDLLPLCDEVIKLKAKCNI